METQNLVISFDYSRFLAKNLAYAECRIMKFHYRNSSNVQSNLKYKFSKEPCTVTAGFRLLYCQLNVEFALNDYNKTSKHQRQQLQTCEAASIWTQPKNRPWGMLSSPFKNWISRSTSNAVHNFGHRWKMTLKLLSYLLCQFRTFKSFFEVKNQPILSNFFFFEEY